ncbi:MinD superfamily P-loop ATPase, contains an inserted ferredoxin domain [Desulfuromusa kysingii]|uniref:MinD superfamily P-loop ATPase, contains an inserted ferredoxin domain n=1 Tax=Desulfuromusa kysingii TaxID=37625 RepID=A0A1H3W9B0_9BACT|nr:ATP-binding protein [Desulfuromusa kysingii]SDZ83441.1 MinD superfamily P-loop ATPase, contains an inserted ferredoxin domain [Desulfuromusa kysingii]
MTRQIAILSGKGGAGKTSITASIIKMMDSVVAVDADVNASNLPILLPYVSQSSSAYYGMDIAQVDHNQCTRCGLCLSTCQFDAISQDDDGKIFIDSDCEGCAACAFVCPVNAISMTDRKGGDWYVSTIDNGFLVHADLIPGEDNSGKLITKVRGEASTLAKANNIAYIVIDGPPGTSCQAISSITGVDLVLAVVEESLSGLSDYRRLAELIQKFSIPHVVLLNKAGFNAEVENKIVQAVEEFNGKIIARIPFDHKIPQALQHLQSLADMDGYREIIAKLLENMKISLKD